MIAVIRIAMKGRMYDQLIAGWMSPWMDLVIVASAMLASGISPEAYPSIILSALALLIVLARWMRDRNLVRVRNEAAEDKSQRETELLHVRSNTFEIQRLWDKVNRYEEEKRKDELIIEALRTERHKQDGVIAYWIKREEVWDIETKKLIDAHHSEMLRQAKTHQDQICTLTARLAELEQREAGRGAK